MTEPTITYGHGFLQDGQSLTGWSADDTGDTTSTTTIENNDVIKIVVNFGTTGHGGIINDVNLALSTSIYTKLYYRYKCSTADVDAYIQVVYSDASTDIALFAASTTWKVGSFTLDDAKTLDHIGLFATSDDGTVYYDFALVCEGAFAFPNAETIDLTAPSDLVRIAYPSRIGRAPHTLGADDTKIVIVCDLDIGDWTRTGDTIQGQVFFDIAHNGSIDEAWQWLTTGQGQAFKARLETPHFIYHGDRHLLNLTFYELRASSADEETYKERFTIT